MAVRVRRVITQELDIPGLGDKIKKAREKDGRSISAICREVGLSRNYWYQLEADDIKGGGALTVETLRKIEAVLNADLGVKFEGDRDDS